MTPTDLRAHVAAMIAVLQDGTATVRVKLTAMTNDSSFGQWLSLSASMQPNHAAGE